MVKSKFHNLTVLTHRQLLGRLTNRIGRNSVVVLCLLINLAVYYVIFISFPYDAATVSTGSTDLLRGPS